MSYRDELSRRSAARTAERNKREAARSLDRQRIAGDPSAYRKTSLKHRYGITPAQYQALFEEQGGLCALCRIRPDADVDHDHKTDQVRALLCRACNVGLGMLQENTELLRAAIAYLEREITGVAATIIKGSEPPVRYRGEAHPSAKLTAANVMEMRAAHKAGESVYSLAKKYGVHQKTARRAITGKGWTHL